MADKETEDNKPKLGVLSLAIKDKAVLHATYISFITNGGLFIPTSKIFKLGDVVSMLLSILDETEKLSVSGTVVWITPKGAQGNRAPGIGVHFHGEEAKMIKNKIENYIAATLTSDKPTHTC